MDRVLADLNLHTGFFGMITFVAADGEHSSGSKVTPADIRAFPKLKLTGQLDSARNSLFTVCLTDLDAPSELNPAFREFRLFVAVNCKLRADNTLDLSGPDTAILSAWPDPAEIVEPDTGNHRICCLVCEQPTVINGQEPFDDRGNRRIWKSKQWIESMGLNPRFASFLICSCGSKAGIAATYMGRVVTGADSSAMSGAEGHN